MPKNEAYSQTLRIFSHAVFSINKVISRAKMNIQGWAYWLAKRFAPRIPKIHILGESRIATKISAPGVAPLSAQPGAVLGGTLKCF